MYVTTILHPMKRLLLSIAILAASVTTPFAQTLVGEQSLTGSKNPSDAYMEFYNAYDRTPLADYYLFYSKKATALECVGYDAPGHAFVLKASPVSALSETAVNAAVDKFLAKYADGTEFAGKPNADIILEAKSGNSAASGLLDRAAKDSEKKLKNSIPAVECVKYDLKSRFGEFKQSGSFEPFEYQTERAIQSFVDKQAKKFGYSQSTDRNEIYNRYKAGDAETVEFVKAKLSTNTGK